MELLIAGGQLDPNIGRVLRRVLERRLAYVDVLVGPGVVPVVSLEYPQLLLSISGRPVTAKSAFSATMPSGKTVPAIARPRLVRSIGTI
jgi:hypothetical protein